ncbi:flagellar hook capping FlgD N-terminal domain-containing protein [Litoreibacter arenae]|uniref:Basal-body rod modification protein FlgD n=1 Tax=Litoreibacter arenae DSM 19593 TaxID=1123360 RepID=S9QCL3_9RHOB|nr:flagellar hook capping FlgD N-terminal domain-containing protein [Litoreibacter arenae]EPX77343.1 Flagellar basal-body rod modification protein FlgD [Litoreibacter arenae DSM 19593]
MEPVSSPTTTNPASSGKSSQSNVISSDFETFLVMLTTQMENQDPLNPLDSQDFATQLATFSGVEQQVKTNDLLGALNAKLLVSSMGDMASWVGMEARMAAPAYFDGAPVEIVANPPNFAQSAELIVKNADGNEVQRLPVPVSDAPFDWAGVTSSGQPFAHGSYSFEVAAYANGELIDSHVPDIFAKVTEIRTVDREPVVVVDGGAIYQAALVTGLR